MNVPCTHYVIRWRGELWWCPGRSGYTTELLAAGVYGEAEALRLAGGRPEDKAVLLTEALAGLEERTVGDFLGARQYLKHRSRKLEES